MALATVKEVQALFRTALIYLSTFSGVWLNLSCICVTVSQMAFVSATH